MLSEEIENMELLGFIEDPFYWENIGMTVLFITLFIEVTLGSYGLFGRWRTERTKYTSAE